jgi:sulfite exporter TauE/SafE
MQGLTLLTVFLAGLFGSTHCVAMCGGIATALSTAPPGASRRWQVLLYHAGRIGSYGLIGALVGMLGLAGGFSMEAQRWGAVLRLITALFIVLIGLNLALGSNARPSWLRAPERAGAWLWRRIAPLARAASSSRSRLRAVQLGMLWGWLPCGLVYSTLIASAASGNPLRGGEIMVAFGLGTLPAMLGVSFAAVHLPRRDSAVARVLGAVIVACGLWTAALPLGDLTGTSHHHHHSMAGM